MTNKIHLTSHKNIEINKKQFTIGKIINSFSKFHTCAYIFLAGSNRPRIDKRITDTKGSSHQLSLLFSSIKSLLVKLIISNYELYTKICSMLFRVSRISFSNLFVSSIKQFILSLINSTNYLTPCFLMSRKAPITPKAITEKPINCKVISKNFINEFILRLIIFDLSIMRLYTETETESRMHVDNFFQPKNQQLLLNYK